MATKKKRLKGLDILEDWSIGVLQWSDPTLFTEPLNEEDTTSGIVKDQLATKFTFGFWRRDLNGDYTVCSEVCSMEGEIQFDQRTLIPKALIQKALDFRLKD